MKIGTQVYTYHKDGMKAGVIVSKALRWNPFPYNEYIVREVKTISNDGIAGVLQAAFNGNPESLSMHTRDTLYLVHEAPVQAGENDES